MSGESRSLEYIETQIGFGNYNAALEACRRFINIYSGTKLEDTSSTSTYKQPWLFRALGIKDLEVPNHKRNDSIIVEKFKTKIYESLCLFYLFEAELGTKLLENTIKEIEKIKNKLQINYKTDLLKFIDTINEEIRELHLLSSFIDIENKDQINEVINIEKYVKMSENELYLLIGKSIPVEVKTNSKVLNSKLLLLKTDSKILLPASLEINTEVEIENLEFGKKFTNALKKRLYNILCDSKNRVGKNYVTTDNIKTLVSGSILSIGITSHAVIAPFIVFVLLFGIDTYCEMSKPKELDKNNDGYK